MLVDPSLHGSPSDAPYDRSREIDEKVDSMSQSFGHSVPAGSSPHARKLSFWTSFALMINYIVGVG